MSTWNPFTLWTRPLDVTPVVPTVWAHGTQSPSGQDPLMSPLQYPLYELMGPSHPLDKTPWCHPCSTNCMNSWDPVTLWTRPLDVTSAVPTVWTHGTQSPCGQDPLMSPLQYPLYELMEPSHTLDKTPWCHPCSTNCMNSWDPVTLWTRPLDVTSAAPIAWSHGTHSPSGQDPLMSPLQYQLYELMGPSHPLDKTPWCHPCSTNCMNSWDPVTLWTRPLDVTLQYQLYELMGPSHPLDKTPWCHPCSTHCMNSWDPVTLWTRPLDVTPVVPTVWTHGTQSPSGQDPMECITKVWWIATVVREKLNPVTR